MSGVIEYTSRAGFGIHTELASTEFGISNWFGRAWYVSVMYWFGERFHLRQQQASRSKDRISGGQNTFNKGVSS